MKKEINLEDVLSEIVLVKKLIEEKPLLYYHILKAMKQACDQTVELCAENAVAYRTNEDEIKVSKQSILNTKNQIK